MYYRQLFLTKFCPHFLITLPLSHSGSPENGILLYAFYPSFSSKGDNNKKLFMSEFMLSRIGTQTQQGKGW
jgi:hypothetical protein